MTSEAAGPAPCRWPRPAPSPGGAVARRRRGRERGRGPAGRGVLHVSGGVAWGRFRCGARREAAGECGTGTARGDTGAAEEVGGAALHLRRLRGPVRRRPRLRSALRPAGPRPLLTAAQAGPHLGGSSLPPTGRRARLPAGRAGAGRLRHRLAARETFLPVRAAAGAGTGGGCRR